MTSSFTKFAPTERNGLMLEIYSIHHLPSERRNVVLGLSDDKVDPTLVASFQHQTEALTQLVSYLIYRYNTSAAVYTSSMPRQRETSELLFGQSKVPIIVDERLRQIDNGPVYTGMQAKRAKLDYLSYIDKPFPGGESFNEFAGRIKSFLNDTWMVDENHIVITVDWRLGPAIFAHVCRGVDLGDAITNVKDIRGPFFYKGCTSASARRGYDERDSVQT